MNLKYRYGKNTNKCLAYCKKMITSKKWPVQSKIPTITKLAIKLKVSSFTTYRAIKILESIGYLENYGRQGFYVISKYNYDNNKQVNLLFKAKKNLFVSMLLDKGALFTKGYVIYLDENNQLIKTYNIISNKIEEYNINDIKLALWNPLTLDMVLKNKSLYHQFQKQENIIDFIKYTRLNIKKLGINLY